MNVIIKGDLDRLRKVQRFECNACGCVFDAEKGEYEDMSDQHNGIIIRCLCPTCGRDCYNYKR